MSNARLILILAGVVTAGLFLAYAVLDPMAQACRITKEDHPGIVCARHAEMVLVLTIILSALITLFGTLALPGGQDEDGSYGEQRVRLAIAMSVLVVYLEFFCMSVFWGEGTFNQGMVSTLTNLLMVVIPFYFGASAVAQIAKKNEKGAMSG